MKPNEAVPDKKPASERATLWLLISGPLLWMFYFLVAYITGAVWCAKVVGRDGSLNGARLAIGAYTIVTLIGIAAVIWRGGRKAALGSAAEERDFKFDTQTERHRFLGFATVLLGGLSAVATIYVALPILFIGTCT